MAMLAQGRLQLAFQVVEFVYLTNQDLIVQLIRLQLQTLSYSSLTLHSFLILNINSKLIEGEINISLE